MSRRNLAEILKSAAIDPRREYERLFTLFYEQDCSLTVGQKTTLRQYCAVSFSLMPFKGTCISLDDFDQTHNFSFVKKPVSFDVDYLILFCEYTYNLSSYSRLRGIPISFGGYDPFFSYIQHVNQVIEMLGYMETKDGALTIFVPKNQAAISVTETSSPKISYKIVEYNHHSMKGDLDRKLSTLKMLADEIEPKRAELKKIPNSVESELFQLLQKFVRHNNKENPVIASMSDDEIEAVYDDIYQMWLLAMLELDNVERKNRAKELLGRINS